jgi:hypothetical protein
MEIIALVHPFKWISLISIDELLSFTTFLKQRIDIPFEAHSFWLVPLVTSGNVPESQIKA